jgi:hypothetical protein
MGMLDKKTVKFENVQARTLLSFCPATLFRGFLSSLLFSCASSALVDVCVMRACLV